MNSGEQGEIPTSDLLKTSRTVNFECTQTGAVPARILLGQLVIGPNAFLQSGLKVLREMQQNEKLPEVVSIRPVPEYPVIIEREDFRNFSFKGWTIFPPDFEGKNVLRVIRLQSWTAKPVVTIDIHN